jgi:hypothetical protein
LFAHRVNTNILPNINLWFEFHPTSVHHHAAFQSPPASA